MSNAIVTQIALETLYASISVVSDSFVASGSGSASFVAQINAQFTANGHSTTSFTGSYETQVFGSFTAQGKGGLTFSGSYQPPVFGSFTGSGRSSASFRHNLLLTASPFLVNGASSFVLSSNLVTEVRGSVAAIGRASVSFRPMYLTGSTIPMSIFTNPNYPNRIDMRLGFIQGPLVSQTLGPLVPTEYVSFYANGARLNVADWVYDAGLNRYLVYVDHALPSGAMIQAIHHMPVTPFFTPSTGFTLPGFALLASVDTSIDPVPNLTARYFSKNDNIDFGTAPALYLTGDWSAGMWILVNSQGSLLTYAAAGSTDTGAAAPYAVSVLGGPQTFQIGYAHQYVSGGGLATEAITFDQSSLFPGTWYYVGISRDATANILRLFIGDQTKLNTVQTIPYVNAPGIAMPDSAGHFTIGSPYSVTAAVYPNANSIGSLWIWDRTTSFEDHKTVINGFSPTNDPGFAVVDLGLDQITSDALLGVFTGTINGTVRVAGPPLAAITA